MLLLPKKAALLLPTLLLAAPAAAQATLVPAQAAPTAPALAPAGGPTVLSGYAGQQALAEVLFHPSAAAASATLPFRRDTALTHQAEALTVRQVAGTSAPAGEQLARLFASQDVLATWGTALRQFGLGLDNVADALTANWLVLYLSANQLAAPPTAAQVAGLRRQLRRVCALPGIGGRLQTSTQRQQLADYLHLQSLLLNEAQSGAEASHDAAARAALAQRARQVAQQNMGFDPTTVRLTATGLVKK